MRPYARAQEALKGLEQYVYCSSAGVYLKSDQMPHREVDAVDPKSRHKARGAAPRRRRRLGGDKRAAAASVARSSHSLPLRTPILPLSRILGTSLKPLPPPRLPQTLPLKP